MTIIKKKLLIVITTQFGYHTDTYMYCKYLDKSKYSVSFFCFDMKFPRIDLPEVSVIYMPLFKNKIKRYLFFLWGLHRAAKKTNYDIIFQVYTKFPLGMKIMTFGSKMILDIRTGDVSVGNYKRALRNYKLLLTTLFFKRITIVSESLQKKLHINPKKCNVIPLGGEVKQRSVNGSEKLRLLYTGTLSGRKIHDTIFGLSYFHEKNPHTDFQYDIIGNGDAESLHDLQQSIAETGLAYNVKYHGGKKITELEEYFLSSNVGIVYVPRTPFYECQPVTKLFEYLLAGMPVIATGTYENKLIVTPCNGVLCEDNPESFSVALNMLLEKKDIFRSETIIDSVIDHDWKNIVNNILSPILDNFTISRNK